MVPARFPKNSLAWESEAPFATRVCRQNRLTPPPIDCQNLGSVLPPLIDTVVCWIGFSRSRRIARQWARRIGNTECGAQFNHNNHGESHAKNSALCPHVCSCLGLATVELRADSPDTAGSRRNAP